MNRTDYEIAYKFNEIDTWIKQSKVTDDFWEGYKEALLAVFELVMGELDGHR